MGIGIYEILWFFLIYSVVGWTVEVAFIALVQGRFVNRGFLNGPVCPIYGFGMVGVLLLLGPVSDNLLALFLGGMVLCTLVEFFGGWALDKIFHMRWWDYSDKPFNLKGYICLGYSVMWGLGVVLVVRVIHPLIAGFILSIPRKIGIVPMVILYIVYAVDLAVTIKTMIGITRSLGELERIAEGLHQLGDEMSSLVGNVVTDTTGVVEKGRDGLTEAMEKGREAVEKGRDGLTEAMEKGREAMEKGRDGLTEAIEKGKNEWSELTEKSRLEWNERTEKSRLEWNERTEKSKAELMARKEQLEERSAALLKRISNTRVIKAFPGVRRSKSKIKLSEELKKMREKYNND